MNALQAPNGIAVSLADRVKRPAAPIGNAGQLAEGTRQPTSSIGGASSARDSSMKQSFAVKKTGPPTAGSRSMLPTFKAVPEVGGRPTAKAGDLNRTNSGLQFAPSGNRSSISNTTSPSGNFSFIATPMQSNSKQVEQDVLGIQDALSTSSSSISASLKSQVQTLMASSKGNPRSVAKTDLIASNGNSTVAVASLETSASAERSNLSGYDKRINELEGSIKAVDKTIKEYQPVADQVSLIQVLKHCEALASEIDAKKKSRQALEERARQLGKLLHHERGEREAWLVAFLKSLHTTLQELTNCIDHSISDSSRLMTNSMDGTDEIMSHLIDRVDQLLIQKESELAPVLEHEET